MKTPIIAIGIMIMFTGVVLISTYNMSQRVAVSDKHTVAGIEATQEPKPTDTPIPTTYTPPPIQPTTIPTPTISVSVLPTAQDKTIICQNEAQLKKMQLKEQLAQIAVSKLPAGSDWALVQQGIENEAQKAYLQIYNICLTR